MRPDARVLGSLVSIDPVEGLTSELATLRKALERGRGLIGRLEAFAALARRIFRGLRSSNGSAPSSDAPRRGEPRRKGHTSRGSRSRRVLGVIAQLRNKKGKTCSSDSEH